MHAGTTTTGTTRSPLLVEDPVPVVSFAFGCPPRDVIDVAPVGGTRVVRDGDERRRRGGRADARRRCGLRAGHRSGAHRGGFVDEPRHDHLPLEHLLAVVTAATSVPVIAAGALMDGDDVARVLAAGAVAAQLGTAFLLAPESGANEAHRRRVDRLSRSIAPTSHAPSPVVVLAGW